MGRSKQHREHGMAAGALFGTGRRTMHAIYVHPAASPAREDEAPSTAAKTRMTGQPDAAPAQSASGPAAGRPGD